MTEKNSTGLVYDNIFPRSIGKDSKKINFHDGNDLILNSQKEEIRKFAKKTNLLFFFISLAFLIFILINLYLYKEKTSRRIRAMPPAMMTKLCVRTCISCHILGLRLHSDAQSVKHLTSQL